MSDKEVLIQSIEKYVTDTASKLFGISSLPAQALMKYAVRNSVDKYGFVIDMFVDKSGKINTDLLIGALKAEIKARNGYEIMGVRFTCDDVDEFCNILMRMKSSNNIN